jgi:tripartite-type tricarboxylate transporter receptor subunit TctC
MMIMSPLVAVPNVKGGKLRALGVTSAERISVLPDVPTIAESGFPGYENVAWHSIVMPAKTPQPIVKRMHTEFVKILQLPEVKDRIQAQGLTVVGSTPEALADLIKTDAAKYKRIIQEIGLKPQ